MEQIKPTQYLTRIATNKVYLRSKLAPLIEYGWEDPNILEAQCNADGQCWFVTRDKNTILKGSIDHNWVNEFVQWLTQYHDTNLTPEHPYLVTNLPLHGEQIIIKIPPIIPQASFVLRKPTHQILSLQEYVMQGVLTRKQACILSDAIIKRKNILISGQFGAGKTTFVNALLDTLATEAPVGHRVVLLEQIRELQCQVANCESLVTQDSMSMRQLLSLAMRNSPERIVIGELYDGGTVIDCCKAWRTVCHGSIATVHASSASEAIQRLLDLALEVVVNPPHTLITEAIDMIVHIETNNINPTGRIVQEIVTIKSYNTISQQWEIKTLGN